MRGFLGLLGEVHICCKRVCTEETRRGGVEVFGRVEDLRGRDERIWVCELIMHAASVFKLRIV